MSLCSTITSSLTLQNSGNSGSPITIDGAAATMGTTASVNTSNRDWWVLQHLHWADHPTVVPITITGGTNGIVDDALADNLDENALNFAQGTIRPTTMTVRNSFFRTRAFNFGQTEHDVMVSEGAVSITIEGNYLEQRAQGQGGSAHNDILQCFEKGGSSSGPNSDWVIRYNTFVMNSASSPSDRSWTMLESLLGTNYIYGNVFLSLQGGEAANGMALEVVAGATYNVYNNTFVSKSGSDALISAGVGTGTLTLRNNIVASGSQTALRIGPATVNRSFNHWFGSDIPSCGGFTGEVCGTDPLFTNYTANDFSLQSSSIDKGGGTNAGSPYGTGISPTATFPSPALVTRTVPWDRGAFVAGTVVLAAPTHLRLLP